MYNLFLRNQSNAMLNSFEVYSDSVGEDVANTYLNEVGLIEFAVVAITENKDQYSGALQGLYDQTDLVGFYEQHRNAILAWLTKCAKKSGAASRIEYTTNLVKEVCNKESHSCSEMNISTVSIIINGKDKRNDYYHSVVSEIAKISIKSIVDVFNKVNKDAKFQKLGAELTAYISALMNKNRDLEMKLPLANSTIDLIGINELVACYRMGSNQMLAIDAMQFYTPNRVEIIEWLNSYVVLNKKGSIIEFVKELMADGNSKVNMDDISLAIHADDAYCSNYDEIVDRIVIFIIDIFVADFCDFMSIHDNTKTIS